MTIVKKFAGACDMAVNSNTAAMALAMLTAFMCVACGETKYIQERPEPWQVLDPGKPLEKFPTPHVLTPGNGVAIEMGDLVQVHIDTYLTNENKWHDFGNWWLWTGFNDGVSL